MQWIQRNKENQVLKVRCGGRGELEHERVGTRNIVNKTVVEVIHGVRSNLSKLCSITPVFFQSVWFFSVIIIKYSRYNFIYVWKWKNTANKITMKFHRWKKCFNILCHLKGPVANSVPTRTSHLAPFPYLLVSYAEIINWNWFRINNLVEVQTAINNLVHGGNISFLNNKVRQSSFFFCITSTNKYTFLKTGLELWPRFFFLLHSK